MMTKCLECDEQATWIRYTQFAGDHPFCEKHAKLQGDFDEDDSYLYWENLEMNDKLEMPLEQFAIAVSKENERLRSGPGGIMEMKQTIADKEAEIERLQDKCDKQAMILRRLSPDKFPDTLFISGVLGNRDMNNMPQQLLVCPAYGVDFSYIYEYTGKTTGPEW